MPLSYLFGLTVVGWIAAEAWIFSRDRRPVAGERADGGSRLLIIAAMAIGIWGAIQLARRVPSMPLPLPHAAAVVMGVAVMWAGIGLRLWAVSVLGRFFRTHVTVLDDHRLVQDGPYARVRNPAYAGALLTCLGFGVAIANWSSLALVLIVPGLAFAWRINVEERALAGRFGVAWDAYRARSWALIPPFW